MIATAPAPARTLIDRAGLGWIVSMASAASAAAAALFPVGR